MNMASITDKDWLKLAIGADGCIWELNGDGSPVNTKKTYGEYIDSNSSDQPVRVIGSRQQAPFLAKLCHTSLSSGRVLEIASPTVCKDAGERNNPEIALYRMQQCFLPASMGGWHRATTTDLLTFALTTKLLQDDIVAAEEAVKQHPIYGALSFVGVNAADSAELVGWIIDPRWFVDKENPNRTSKLRAYMGLTPSIMRLTLEKTPKTGGEQRCKLACRAWTRRRALTGISFDDLVEPGEFLIRSYIRRRLEGMDVMKAGLRTTQRFISYLSSSWIDKLSSPRPKNEPVFDSKLFFQDEVVTAKAFNDHVRQNNRSSA